MQEVTTSITSIKPLLVNSDEFKGIKWRDSQSDAFKSSEKKSRSKRFLLRIKIACSKLLLIL